MSSLWQRRRYLTTTHSADLTTAIAVNTAPSFSKDDLSAYTQSLGTFSAPTPDGASPPNPAPPRSAPRRLAPLRSSTNPPPITAHPSPNQALNPATAAMLADTTFLVDTVLNLPPNPPRARLHKVLAMSNWLQGRLSAAAAVANNNNIHPTNNPSPTATTNRTTTSRHINMTTPRHTNTTGATTTNPNPNPNTHTNTNTTNPTTAIHHAVLLSSQLYCRAIQTRQPLASVAQATNVRDLLEAVRDVPADVWEEACKPGAGPGCGPRSGGGGEGEGGGGMGGGGGGGGDAVMLRTLVSVLVAVLPVMMRMVMVGGGGGNPASGSSSGSGSGLGYANSVGGAYGGRGMVVAAVVRLALVDWEGAVRVLGRVVRLQAWLRGVGGG